MLIVFRWKLGVEAEKGEREHLMASQEEGEEELIQGVHFQLIDFKATR